MKNLTITILLTMLLISQIGLSQSNEKLLKTYLVLKDNFYSQDLNAIKDGASKMLTAAKELSEDPAYAAELSTIKMMEENLQLISSSKKINAIQQNFHQLSIAVWNFSKKSNQNTALYFQFCPMKKYNWIAAEEKIKNPYYGKSMSNCGETIETLNKQ